MNIDEMTPEQLREYAAKKDAARKALENRYIDDGEVAATEHQRAPWEQLVEFEGEGYWVDVRRTKSMSFVRQFAKVQRSQKESKDGTPDIDAVIGMMDTLFAGETHDSVVAHVVAEKGYDDFEEIYRIEAALMEGLDLKN